MLPGQQMINGVSNFLFGSNVPPDYNQSRNARITPQIQALIKQAGITLLRCAITAGSADSYIDLTAQACANMNATMLVILSYRSGSAWNQQLVQRLGNKCLLYEFSNEPDIASPAIRWQDYLAAWNQQIPILRQLNPQAAFLGPALGVYANVGSYLVPWLQGCVSSGVMPDGVSFHNYPCTGTGDAATCATKTGSLGVSATKLAPIVRSIAGRDIPLCITEWGIDANPSNESYLIDPNFAPDWTKKAIDGMVQAGVAMACQFDAGSGAANEKLDLIKPSNFQPQPMYGAMAERIKFYLGATPPPPPPPPTITLSATPSPLTFSGMVGASTLPAQLVTLTNTGNATASYSVSASSWLDVAPLAGSVAPGASVGSLVGVNLANLQPGFYSSVVTYAAGTATASVGVQLTVLASPPPPPPPQTGLQMAMSGPLAVTRTATAFPHNLGVTPDVVLTSLSIGGDGANQTCYVDYTTLNATTVTLRADSTVTAYIVSIKF